MVIHHSFVEQCSSSSSCDACGCKGVRYCKLCEFSTRVQQLKLPHSLDAYDDYKCYVYEVESGCAYLNERLHVKSSLADIQGSSADSDSKRLVVSDLLLIYEFISEADEEFLIRKIDSGTWRLSQSGRRKQDYGPKVNFKRQKVKVDAFDGVPDYADLMLQKVNALFEKNGSETFDLLEMCNLEYTLDRNSSIEMHTDDAWIWGERLISINLFSGTVMTLEDAANRRVIFVPLPRRSILVMSSVVRHEYMHGIFPHHIVGRRLVITMREAAASFKIGGHNYETYGKELSEKAKIRLSSV